MRIEKIKLFKGLQYLLILVLCLYTYLRIKNNLLNINPEGDEGGFVKGFQFFLDNGWKSSELRGHAGLYYLLSYPIYLITNKILLSLKMVSLLSTFLSVYIVGRMGKEILLLKQKLLNILILTASNIVVVSSFMFFAYDDNLMILCMLLFIEVYLRFKKKLIGSSKFILLFGFYTALFFSLREMSIIFIPSMLILIFMVYKELTVKEILKLVLIFIISIFLLNRHSILANQKISYHDKGSPSSKFNWTQFQYLSQMKKYQGSLNGQMHITWEELEAYVEKNGEKSLPNTTLEAIHYNYILTVKVFVANMILFFKSYLRLAGIFLILLPFYFYKYKSLSNKYLLIFISVYSLILNFIIMSYLETRWVIGIYLLLLFWSIENINSLAIKKYKNGLINIHLLLLIIFSLPYLYKNL